MPMLTLDPHLEKLVTFDHTINACMIFETKNVRYNLVMHFVKNQPNPLHSSNTKKDNRTN